MRKAVYLIVAILCAALAGAAAATATAAEAGLRRRDGHRFRGSGCERIQLTPRCRPIMRPARSRADGSLWYIVTVANSAPRPVVRILLVERAG